MVRSGIGLLSSLRYDLRLVLIQARLSDLNWVAWITPGVILDFKFVVPGAATGKLDPYPAILDASAAIEAKANSVGAWFHPTRKIAAIVLEAP